MRSPRVFISYSHDSPDHMERVLELTDRLRHDGLDAWIDQYETSPPEGWPRWMRDQIEEADFVLVVCTENYERRFLGEPDSEGLGVQWEGNIITLELYSMRGKNSKFVPIFFFDGDREHIPIELQGTSRYNLRNEHGYEELYRRLTTQPKAKSPPLGMLRRLPIRKRQQSFASHFPWHVAYSRNEHFTGREGILEEIWTGFKEKGRAIQAISGLGGMGKTQTVIEYVYRYRAQYRAVFWIRAGASMKTDFVEIAKVLDLPEKDAHDQDDAIAAVQKWLQENVCWLVVLDDVQEPSTIAKYIIPNPQGYFLVTSRAPAFDDLGVTDAITIDSLSPEQSLSFLMNRTNRTSLDDPEKEAAKEIARDLGYLPLALEQAGAYMLEEPARFRDYLVSYKKRRLELMSRSRPKLGNYREKITTTWAMNFREVEETSETSGDLLRVSAFLDPARIPLEFFVSGYRELGPTLSKTLIDVEDDPLVLTSALRPLARYSLIHRSVADHSYTLHPLVQEVLRHEMDRVSRSTWTGRITRALNLAFPEIERPETSVACDRLLPHVGVVAKFVQEYDTFSKEAGRLLSKAGKYAVHRRQYTQAEPLWYAALQVHQRLSEDHLDLILCLNNLAMVYRIKGHSRKALPLCHKALAIGRRMFGAIHIEVARSLHELALAQQSQGNLPEAESLLRESLGVHEKLFGPSHVDVAQDLSRLAVLRRLQADYQEAESLHQRALSIREDLLGSDHWEIAESLNSLATLYKAQDRNAEAAPLYERALKIRIQAFGPENFKVAASLNNLAQLREIQGHYHEAEELHRRALAIWEKTSGPLHRKVALSLNNLAELYRAQGRDNEAEAFYKRALEIGEKALGPDHPDVTYSLNNLGALYRYMGRYVEAEELYRRALTIRQSVLGQDHPDVALSLHNLAVLYRYQKRYAEAEPLHVQALAILETRTGADPRLASILEGYSILLQQLGRENEATEVHRRAEKLKSDPVR